MASSSSESETFKTFFQNKNVLVTGAGKGIGRALAIRLSTQLNAQVYAISRTEEDLISLKAECPNINTIQVDLMSWEDTKNIFEVKGGQLANVTIDVLVNNAAIADSWQPLLNTTEETFDRVFGVNLKAVVNLSQLVVQKLIAEGKSGNIVNISSVGSFRPFKPSPLYSTSKAALSMLTKLMAVEWGVHGVRVNAVNFGFVQTPMTEGAFGGDNGLKCLESVLKEQDRLPLGKSIIPMTQAVDTLLFLGSGLTPMMTGASLTLDGGLSLT